MSKLGSVDWGALDGGVPSDKDDFAGTNAYKHLLPDSQTVSSTGEDAPKLGSVDWGTLSGDMPPSQDSLAHKPHERHGLSIPTDGEHRRSTQIEHVQDPRAKYVDIACAHTYENASRVAALIGDSPVVASERVGYRNQEAREQRERDYSALTSSQITDESFKAYLDYLDPRRDKMLVAILSLHRNTDKQVVLLDMNKDNPNYPLTEAMQADRQIFKDRLRGLKPLNQLREAMDNFIGTRAKWAGRRDDIMARQLADLNERLPANTNGPVSVAIIRGSRHDRVGTKLSDAGYSVERKEVGLSETGDWASYLDQATMDATNHPDQPINERLRDRAIFEDFFNDFLIFPSMSAASSHQKALAAEEFSEGTTAKMDDQQIAAVLQAIDQVSLAIESQTLDYRAGLMQVLSILNQHLPKSLR